MPGNYAVSLQLPPRQQDFGQFMFVVGSGGNNGIPGTRVETRIAAGQTVDVDPATGTITSDSGQQQLWTREYAPDWMPKV